MRKLPVAPSAEDEVIHANTIGLVIEVLSSVGERSLESSIQNRLNRAQRMIEGRIQSGRLGLEK